MEPYNLTYDQDEEGAKATVLCHATLLVKFILLSSPWPLRWNLHVSVSVAFHRLVWWYPSFQNGFRKPGISILHLLRPKLGPLMSFYPWGTLPRLKLCSFFQPHIELPGHEKLPSGIRCWDTEHPGSPHSWTAERIDVTKSLLVVLQAT